MEIIKINKKNIVFLFEENANKNVLQQSKKFKNGHEVYRCCM
jgi:hypothetical protein